MIMYIFSMTQLVSWIEVPSTVASVFNPNLKSYTNLTKWQIRFQISMNHFRWSTHPGSAIIRIRDIYRSLCKYEVNDVIFSRIPRQMVIVHWLWFVEGNLIEGGWWNYDSSAGMSASICIWSHLSSVVYSPKMAHRLYLQNALCFFCCQDFLKLATWLATVNVTNAFRSRLGEFP